VVVAIGLAGDECVEVVEERCVVELGVEVRQRPVTCPAIWPVRLEALDDIILVRLTSVRNMRFGADL
jgi:hypothetical protein